MTTPKKTYTGGRFQLDIAGHNVGYLQSTGSDTTDPGPGPARWRTGVPLEPFKGLAELGAAARGRQPRGVHGILIGLDPLPRYQHVVGKDGSTGILIGLSLPAVMPLLEPVSSKLALLAAGLRQGGWIGVRLADGSVRQLFGPKQREKYWELGEDG
jgi:hypothetical protein